MESSYGQRTSTPKPNSVQNRSPQQQSIESFFRDDMVDVSEQFYNSTLFDGSDDILSHLYQQSFISCSEDSSVFVEFGEQDYTTHRKYVYDIKTRQINNLFECIELKLQSMQKRMRGTERSHEMDGERMCQDNLFCSTITVISDGVKHTAM